ncbi:uncharacterized protein LOC128889575 [Hylaeus anthracinus]|uniref:uncharacterized protein LOC128889575 n=1 Tax=Hylaeus anthracinus TaxID=313031 RepID=UPI0023B98D9F|nr:uncharacterized protein LOC128889575 [Hylaeus anthracinus]
MKELYLPIVAILAVGTGDASAEILKECPPYNSVDTTVYIAHEFDCTKFYKCFMGEKYEMDCDSDNHGNKLYFNPDLQMCDWRWNVTCKNEPDRECAMVNNGFVWPNPFDCSSYYMCGEGKKWVRYCDEGMLFDPAQLRCRIDQDMTCNNLPEKCPPPGSSQTMLLPYECSCSEYYECSNGDAFLRHCHSGELFDRKLKKCVSKEIADCNLVLPTTNPLLDTNDTDKIRTSRCPANGSHEIVYLPHECMCNMYFLCKDGELIRQFCPKGEVFDDVNQVCDFPTITSEPTESTESSTITTIPTKPTDPSANGRCPPSGHVKIPHETDCNRYYECLNGVEKPSKCLDGHYFNELLQICDLPENTKCHSSKDAECSTDFRCGIIRFPDHVNCSLYHQCENGRKVLKECSPNLLYNPDKEMCDLPRYVNCSQVTQHCIPGDKTPHECRCDTYYICSADGMHKTLQLCDQGSIFDYMRKECDAPVKSKCWRKEKSQICDPGEWLPHEYRCDEYYECSKDGKMKILRQCTEGLRFNRERKMCDKDANAKCWGNSDSLLCEPNELLPHECQCDKYYECARDGQSKILRNCKKGLLFDSERNECVAQDRVNRWCDLNSRNDIEHGLGCIDTCPPHDSLPYTVHLPHQDCSKFCKCSNGIPYIMKCPQGLHFSKTDAICTYPREADCNTLNA